ncbi:RNA methyltransferase, TrmH family [Cellulosimicrobium aquatile]|uniref:RNA methyltransferase, TrmH family n=1 Tax=Cellulosimicrobium aquatile TaxID=1612203 RepID=A0A1N6VV35_9MICO|nr:MULTISPECIES: RNA methyltransferase [Cellulosimicrobium]MCM3535893.1 RNA methyltransferase [Cellulosimicrobium funkei]MDQ8040251.1 RNA methyltransferase [Cellulosimicrobium sp. XJ-DQ-B-000]NMF30642.1 RNA methyltransferase [Cellulosimicrobium aquatile]SIQ81615.1 RNA methyltransferase, TrmH family [Cellulosimicrobium aquatile]
MTNPRSDRVKAVRALAGRPARSRHGQLLVEGPQGVREAVRHAPDQVRDVYVTPAAAERHPEIVADARAAGLHVHGATPEVLAAMSADAQGVLAVVRADAPRLEDVVATLARRDRPALVAVLATVRDPGNAGTVVRAADAAGADAVVLAGESVDVHNPKVVRSTAGSLFHLPVVTGVSLAEAVAALRGAGLAVLAADGAGDLDLDDLLDVAGAAGAGTERPVDLAAPTAWVFGNEAWGLPPEDRALADAVVRVPIRGRAESLNLATAATVCLYASSRAHRPARGPGADPEGGA